MQSTKIYKTDEIPKNILDTIKYDYEHTSYPDMHNEIYEEQLLYIRARKPDSFLVAAFVNDVYFGGIILFLNTGYEGVGRIMIDVPSPGIQGIARSQKGLEIPVKLNSLLIPTIKEFLLKRGYHAVYVAPVGNQIKILLDHYGFILHEDSRIYSLVLNF